MGRPPYWCGSCKECEEQRLGPEPGSQPDNENDSQDEKEIPGYPIGPAYYKRRKWKAFVESAPSHDPSKPCFAAYLALYPVSVEFDDDDHPLASRRPLFGIRIYDVTPQAGDVNRTRDLAVKINASTEWTRHTSGHGGPYYDRLEIIGMPLDARLSDLEKAKICAAYDDKEREARMATGDSGFYIPLRITDNLFRRVLIMIDRLEVDSGWESHLCRGWNTDEYWAADKMPPEESRDGSFAIVDWQPRPQGWEDIEEPIPPADLVLCRPKFPFELFALIIAADDMMRLGINKFYEHYVADGRLEQELRRAKEAAEGLSA